MSRSLLRRLGQLEQAFEIGREHTVGLDQLERQLCCSRRNVSNILAGLQSLGWIQWAGAVGRGRQSALTLCMGVDGAREAWIASLVAAGELQQAARLAAEAPNPERLSRQIQHFFEQQQQAVRSSGGLLVADYP